MKILIISQYFWPENFKINDLSIELIKRNNEVFALTGKPNYPNGKFFKGYGFFGFKKELYKGIQINRVPMLPRKNSSNLNLFLNYLTFFIFSNIFILFNKRKYDLIFCPAYSPVTVIFSALLAKVLYKSKCYVWIQDLWPESTYLNGRIKNNFIKFLLNKMMKFLYQHPDKIFIQAESMRIPIREKLSDKYDNSKVIYLPNWAEDHYYKKNTYNKASKYLDLIKPSFFNVLFAGNIGSSVDVKSIFKTIFKLKDNTKIKFIFIGDGSEKEIFQSNVLNNKLKNVEFIPRHDAKEVPQFFEKADLLLTSFGNIEIFKYILPSKVPTYMASAKPIVGMANGETALTIKKAKCGYIVPACDYNALAQKIILMSNMSKNELFKLGQNGKKYSMKVFNRDTVIDEILRK